jgi:isopenicillin N synthase-like dioxygenase
MKYAKRNEEEYKKLEESGIEHAAKGHTGNLATHLSTNLLLIARLNKTFADLGTFTFLFRQPVAGLQIRYPSTNEWKWVKPQDATLTVNAADALQFLTGGYVNSTIHR